MADKFRDKPLHDSYLESDRKSEPLSEAEIERRRRANSGAEYIDQEQELRPRDPEDAEVTRRGRTGVSVDEHRATMRAKEPIEDRERNKSARRGEPGRQTTGDEAYEAKLRATGRGTSEGEHTQVEEDFGERGRRMRGGVHDSTHNPSILDPEPE